MNQLVHGRVLALLLVLLLAGVTTTLNRQFYNHHPAESESLIYFPNSGAGLHAYALGFDRFMADLLWMRTLTYFGNHFEGDGDYRYLASMLDIITRLNPRHEDAYYISALTLPWMAGAVAESRALMIRAMVNLPDDGRWPYYLGFNQYLFEDRMENARHFLTIAINRGYVNSLSASLAARLSAHTDSLETARSFLLQNLQKSTLDRRMRGYLQQQLAQVETEMVLRAIESYLAASHTKPHTPQEIAALGIKWPEPLPDGGTLIVNNKQELRSSTTSVRFDLHISKHAKAFHRQYRALNE